ncbi:hypothetical protein AVEN_97916-1, partial [Araneus ventricosus]
TNKEIAGLAAMLQHARTPSKYY